MNGIFTNNWTAAKNLMLIGAASNATNGQTGVTDMYDTYGARCRPDVYIISPLNGLVRGYNPSGDRNAIRFGTSDTAPAATDIDLGTPWSSGLTYVEATSGNMTWSGNTASRTFTVTVQNTAAASVTVREFGLFAYVVSGGSYSYSMLYREVLDTPVTLAQYDSATLTFTVSMTIADPV